MDNSWIIALNLAWKYGLEFGKDFIFTYGPLGILESRLPISINLLVYLFFDIYLLVNAFIVLKEILKEHFNYGSVIFIFLNIMLAQYGEPYQWYFFFFLFFLFSFIKSPDRKIHLIHAALLSMLSFYFKVSLGIISVSIFLMAITYVLIRKKRNLKWYGAVLLSYLLTFWLSARLLHVNLGGYIKGSLRLIDNYNDVMSRILEDKLRIYLYAAILIIFMIACWLVCLLITAIRKKELAKHLDRFFIYSLTCLGIFVLFKSSFVRSNMETFHFFQYISLYIALLYLYAPGDYKKGILAGGYCIILAISIWTMNTIPAVFKPYITETNLSFIRGKINDAENYVRQVKSYNKRFIDLDSQVSRDNTYKAIIGSHTADIIPMEISKIYFNGLHYHPRPVIQSYAAYDEYLDDLNYRKYAGADAPDYILFSLGSIDYRYPFFDETKTKMAILSHYRVLDELNGELILRKRDAYENMKESALADTVHMTFGEDIPVKNSRDLQYSRIFIRYNLWGRTRRLFYQPPSLKMVITLENDDVVTFRVMTPILAGGVILNKYIRTEKDFQLLMQSDGSLNANVKKVRIEPDSSGAGFAPDIEMINTYYSFPDKTPKEHREDSVGVAHLMNEYDRYKPSLIDSVLYKKGNFRYGINDLMSYSPVITFEGWAFRENSDNNNYLVKAVLRSESKTYEIPSLVNQRADFEEIFRRKDLLNAGFKATVSKSQLPPGDYRIGIIIIDTVNQEKWIHYTDNHVQIPGVYNLVKMNATVPEAAEKDIEYDIEPIKENDDKIFVKGWAFLKKADGFPGATTNLVLQSNGSFYRINTEVTQRTDVADHFNNALLLNCGFRVEIPKSQLPAGIYTIGIEKVYSDGHKRSVIFTAESIKSGIPDIFIPVPVSVLPPTQDFDLGMDYVKDEGDLVSVSGWAIQKMQEVRNSTIGIVLKSDDAIFASGTEARSRPDVTAHFHNRLDLDNCGFFAKISKKPLPAGRYEVGIHVYQNGNAGTVKFIGAFIVKH